jgi:hypothetical protein
MSDFDLDLQSVEEHIDTEDVADWDAEIIVGKLDGSTPDEEWRSAVLEDGNALVLAVEGDINELAAGFARDIRDAGGYLVTFRDMLLIAPPGVSIDTDRV